MGSVVTFYSYKGGVGRSMAVANIAVLLARMGQRVLVIDWDLEAPGIERYFHYFPASGAGTGAGLLALLESRTPTLSYVDFLVPLELGEGASISLLPSGRDYDPIGYAARLERLNWTQFFESGGGDFIENLRRRWKDDFDLVLVDSRTGLSDAGGVCTIQLPDVVVAMFTTNYQSYLGTRDVMRYVRDARQALAYQRMQLTVLPLLSRFSGNEEFLESRRWLTRISEAFSEFYADWLPAWVRPREVLERIKIPQVNYFGFGEGLAVVEQGSSDPTSMGFAFERVAGLLRADFQDAAALIGLRPPVPGPVPEARPQPDYDWDVYVSRSSSVDARWLEFFAETLGRRVSDELGREARVYLDLREIEPGKHWPTPLSQALDRSRLLVPLLQPSYFRSPWAVAEWKTFEHREAVTGRSGLIVPVMIGGDVVDYPIYAGDRQMYDLSALYYGIRPRPGSSLEYLFSSRIAQFASLVADRLREVPPFRSDFPVVEPADVADTRSTPE